MRVEEHYGRIRFHLKQIIFVLPDERNIFKLFNVISWWLLDSLWSLVVIRQQKVVDELLTPLNDASHNVKREHSQRMQNVDALIEQLRMALLIVGSYLVNAKTQKLHVLLICFSEHFF